MTTTGMLCKEGWEIVVLHELSQMVWPVSPGDYPVLPFASSA